MRIDPKIDGDKYGKVRFMEHGNPLGYGTLTKIYTRGICCYYYIQEGGKIQNWTSSKTVDINNGKFGRKYT